MAAKRRDPPISDLETLMLRSRREGECILWTGATTARGYGMFRSNYKPFYAHRTAWEFANGKEIPFGMVVCHRCDTPSCIKPEHLFLGTQADNLRDMANKGRHPRMWRDNVCRNGHVIASEKDMALNKANGARTCRVCRRAYKRRRYHEGKNRSA